MSPSLSRIAVASRKLDSVSLVTRLANSSLFASVLKVIDRLLGISPALVDKRCIRYGCTGSSKYLAILIDSLLCVYYQRPEQDKLIQIGQIALSEPHSAQLHITNNERILVTLQCINQQQWQLELFDLENWCESVHQFSIPEADQTTPFNCPTQLHSWHGARSSTEFTIIVRLADFLFGLKYKFIDNRLVLISEWTLNCANVYCLFDEYALTLSPHRVTCLDLAKGELQHVAQHSINIDVNVRFSTFEEFLLLASPVQNAVWIFHRTTLAFVRKCSFDFAADGLVEFFPIGCHQRLELVYLTSNGNLNYAAENDPAERIINGCLFVVQASLKQFYYGSIEGIGLISSEQFLIISKLTIKDKLDVVVESIKQGQLQLATKDFLSQYLECDPSDSQSIIQPNLWQHLDDSDLQLLRSFIPKGWMETKELFRRLGKERELELLDFFVEYVEFEPSSFQLEFGRFLQLDPMAKCQLFAVNCCIDLLELHQSEVADNMNQILDCIPEYVDPEQYLHLINKKMSSEWMAKRAIATYGSTGNLSFVDSLLANESVLKEKIHFLNSLLVQLDSLEYEQIVPFMACNATDTGFFIFELGGRQTSLFSTFIKPYYDMFYSCEEFDLFLMKFIRKYPKPAIELVENQTLNDSEQLLDIFWNFPQSNAQALAKFIAFYSSPIFTKKIAIKNVIRIIKICLKYKITFNNAHEITTIGRCNQSILDLYDRIFSKISLDVNLEQETFWLELLNDCLELWALLEVKIDKLKIFEKFISCILRIHTPNSIELAKQILTECIDLQVLTVECANSILYHVAHDAFLEIGTLCAPNQWQPKLKFISNCLSLSFDDSGELGELKRLIHSHIPKLSKYLQSIDPLDCDINAHHLLNYSLDWILLNKILPFHSDAYRNPLHIINEFQLPNHGYKQKIMVFCFKRCVQQDNEIRYDLLDEITDPFIWRFLFDLVLQDTGNERLFDALVRSSPPIDVLHRVVSKKLKMEPIKISVKFDQKASWLYAPIKNNLAVYPKLCKFLSKSTFEPDNLEVYYSCHPHLQESFQYFTKKMKDQKETLLQEVKDMSDEQLYAYYLKEPQLESLLPPDLGEKYFQSMFTYILTDPTCPLPAFDQVSNFGKYLTDRYLTSEIFNKDLLLERAELLYYTLLSCKPELKGILTPRIELIYSMQSLKALYCLTDLFQLNPKLLLDLYVGPFQQDVDFLYDFCKRTLQIPIETCVDTWSINESKPESDEIAQSVCKIFLTVTTPSIRRIVQLQNSISLDTYRQVLLNNFDNLDDKIIQLVAIYLEMNGKLTEYDLLNEYPHVLYWMYLKRQLDLQRANPSVHQRQLNLTNEEDVGDAIDFEWQSQEDDGVADFSWEPQDSSMKPSVEDGHLNQIKKVAIKNRLLNQLFEIEDGMTYWTFASDIINRTRLEYFVFFIFNYQLVRNLDLVQPVYEELLTFSKAASKHQRWFSLFLASYLQTSFPATDKKATELAYKCCSLLVTISTRDSMFKQPRVLIQQAIRSSWQQEMKQSATTPFLDCYLNEDDMEESVYCLLIERLFLHDFESIREAIEASLK